MTLKYGFFFILLLFASKPGLAEQAEPVELTVRVLAGESFRLDVLNSSSNPDVAGEELPCVVVMRHRDFSQRETKVGEKTEMPIFTLVTPFNPAHRFFVLNAGQRFGLDGEGEHDLVIEGGTQHTGIKTFIDRGIKEFTIDHALPFPYLIECTRHGSETARLLVVNGEADNYLVKNGNQTFRVRPGLWDVRIWLGKNWHPLRYSAVIENTPLRLEFRARK